jgi:hypothetical protein
MDALVFAYALLVHKADSRAEILALLPVVNRTAVEIELSRIADQSTGQMQGDLRSVREVQIAHGRAKAEERFGLSLKHASPPLIAWLARPF